MRNVAVLMIVAALSLSAAPARRAPSVAPDTFPHPIAMFLSTLCKEGQQQVTFKARAHGVRFYFEEPGTGVTVYRFDNGQYVKEAVLQGFTLDRAMKRYTTR